MTRAKKRISYSHQRLLKAAKERIMVFSSTVLDRVNRLYGFRPNIFWTTQMGVRYDWFKCWL